MVFDASHLFPRDHFQLGIVHDRGEHRLVLRCSADFLDTYHAKNALLNHGRRSRELRNQLKARLNPDIAENPRASARFVQQLREWALLSHHYSGQAYLQREAHLYQKLRQQIPSRATDVSDLLAQFASTYRDYHLAFLRSETLSKLGGEPLPSKDRVQAGFLEHFNRLLNPSPPRPRHMDLAAGPLQNDFDAPLTLVGDYPPKPPLFDLKNHHDYFVSDFDRVRQSGLEPGSALEAVATPSADMFVLKLRLSGPTIAKPVLFERLQDVFARSLQRMGFPVRIMPSG